MPIWDNYRYMFGECQARLNGFRTQPEGQFDFHSWAMTRSPLWISLGSSKKHAGRNEGQAIAWHHCVIYDVEHRAREKLWGYDNKLWHPPKHRIFSIGGINMYKPLPHGWFIIDLPTLPQMKCFFWNVHATLTYFAWFLSCQLPVEINFWDRCPDGAVDVCQGS